MILYSLLTFLIYLAWALSGIAVHVTGELYTAYKTRKDFKLSTFKRRNKYKYLASLVPVVVICAAMAASPSQLKEAPPLYVMGLALGWQFQLVGIGYSGGSIIKKAFKTKFNV